MSGDLRVYQEMAWLEPPTPVLSPLSSNSHGVLIRTCALERPAILGAHLTPANSLEV